MDAASTALAEVHTRQTPPALPARTASSGSIPRQTSPAVPLHASKAAHTSGTHQTLATATARTNRPPVHKCLTIDWDPVQSSPFKKQKKMRVVVTKKHEAPIDLVSEDAQDGEDHLYDHLY